MREDNPAGQDDPYGGGAPGGNWWEGPPPQGWTGAWPPELGPGQSYGPQLGSIIYGPGSNTTVNPDDPNPFLQQPKAPPTTTPPPGPTSAPPPSAPPPPLATSNNTTPGIKPTAEPPPTGPPPGANPGAPTFTPPAYTPPPAFVKPPDFSYADFVAPDPNNLNDDPSFKYQLKTEQDAISRSAAAKGILNTGGTINDLLVNANDVASTGYQNLWNRKMGEYNTNRQGAFDAYKTNYGISADVADRNERTQFVQPFTFGYQGAQDAFNANVHNWDQGQFYAQHAIDQNTATATHNQDQSRMYDWYQKLFGYQQQNDDWEHKFKLLGLI